PAHRRRGPAGAGRLRRGVRRRLRDRPVRRRDLGGRAAVGHRHLAARRDRPLRREAQRRRVPGAPGEGDRRLPRGIMTAQALPVPARTGSPVGRGRRHTSTSPAARARRRLYWPLLLPALAVYVLFLVAPALWGGYISLTEWSGRGEDPVWVGLANYADLAGDAMFQRAFLNTLAILVVSGIGVFAVTFTIASVLREVRWSRPALAIIFFPYLLSPIAVGIALSLLLAPSGLVNAGLRGVGLGALAKQWLTPDLIFQVILVGLVWVSVGFYLTLMMSAIGRIP